MQVPALSHCSWPGTSGSLACEAEAQGKASGTMASCFAWPRVSRGLAATAGLPAAARRQGEQKQPILDSDIWVACYWPCFSDALAPEGSSHGAARQKQCTMFGAALQDGLPTSACQAGVRASERL